MTAMKKGFDERLKAYFNEDGGRWAAKLLDVGHMLRRSTMSCPRAYEGGPVPVSAFDIMARWLEVAKLQLVEVSVKNTGRGWGRQQSIVREEGTRLCLGCVFRSH